VDRASDEDVVAVLRGCCSARDRLIVLLMARAGLRRREVLGLRRSDVHLDAGGTLDEVQDLLGHASISSTQVYAHPDPARLRAAVDAVPSPRKLAGDRR
jgi:integrase